MFEMVIRQVIRRHGDYRDYGNEQPLGASAAFGVVLGGTVYAQPQYLRYRGSWREDTHPRDERRGQSTCTVMGEREREGWGSADGNV